MKRLLAYLLMLFIIIALSSCKNAEEGSKILFYEVDEAEAAYLADSLGFNEADGEKVYLLLKNAGLDEKIESVGRYTDGVTGEVFYRVRTEKANLDLYFYADGSVKIINGKETVLFDAADVSIGIHDETDPLTVTSVSVSVTDVSFDDSVSVDTSYGDSTAYMLTFILNTSSKKYHRPDCRGVSAMSESNKETVCVEDESQLLTMGYIPCGICGGE